MPVHNSDIAKIFERYADLLEISGANWFRVRAYRNAARTINGLAQQIHDLLKNGDKLSDLPGIGKDLAAKIEEIAKSGKLKDLEQLEKKLPAGLSELVQIENLGPKRVKTIYDELGIGSIEQLKQAAKSGEIGKLEGFGQKTEQKILKSIERIEKKKESHRLPWVSADEIVHPLVDYLKKSKDLKKIEIAGSYRRRKEDVGDLDILASASQKSDIMGRFTKYEDVEQVIAEGKTKSSIILKSGLQVDLRVVADISYGSALMYFTGSKAHNVKLRKLAIKKKFKLNEYGLYKGDKRLAGKTEEEMYKKLGLKYIEPELREDTGEIEAASKGKLPSLVMLDDIRGDLQAHTKASDGKYSLEDMAKAARERGYDYLAITDHSKRVTVANGLDEKRLGKLLDEIEKLNAKLKNFQVLKSVEVDILKDGSLDLSNDILKELDIVICSIHYDLDLPRDKQTNRVLKAMDNPHFDIFAHPTGKRLNLREPYDIDLEKVMAKAMENGCFFELNAQPDRLDLPFNYCRMAKDMGLKIAISTDAHSISDLRFMELGVSQARRGWLERDDVLNARSWKELRKMLRRNK